MIDRHGTLERASNHDPLGVAMRDQAAAMLEYWEGRRRLNPTHSETLSTWRAWRGVVRALEDYYDLPRSFETHGERR